jgi:hypothetical protein
MKSHALLAIRASTAISKRKNANARIDSIEVYLNGVGDTWQFIHLSKFETILTFAIAKHEFRHWTEANGTEIRLRDQFRYLLKKSTA